MREEVVSKKEGRGHYLDSKTPVYNTQLNGWPPREMLRKRGTLLEVIRVGRGLGRALQLPLFQHVHPVAEKMNML